jgi:hypothetical protein
LKFLYYHKELNETQISDKQPGLKTSMKGTKSREMQLLLRENSRTESANRYGSGWPEHLPHSIGLGLQLSRSKVFPFQVKDVAARNARVCFQVTE